MQQLLLQLEAFKAKHGRYPTRLEAGEELYMKRARLLEKNDLTTAEREAIKKTQCALLVDVPLSQQVQQLLLELEAFKAEHGKYPTSNEAGRKLYMKRSRLLEKKDLSLIHI